MRGRTRDSMTRAFLALRCLLCLALVGTTARAWAAPPTFRTACPGTVHDVQVADCNRDGRADVAVLARDADNQDVLLLALAPEKPTAGRWVPEGALRVIRLDGKLAHVGALVVGALPGGACIRAFHPAGWFDLDTTGRVLVDHRGEGGTLLARSAGVRPVFWTGAGDLDGDGLLETWVPRGDGNGPYSVQAGERTITLDALETTSQATASQAEPLRREAALPRVTAADLDGDGRSELAAIYDGALHIYDPLAPGAGDTCARRARLALAFLAAPPDADPLTLRTARVQLSDLDRDGAADLLVSLVTGRSDKLGSLRTMLVHYPGPLLSEQGAALPKARARIDSPSVVLHPTFADMNGDGRRDYVGASIRNNNLFTVASRMLGKDPPLTAEIFPFDANAGTLNRTHALRHVFAYPSGEALGNRFRPTLFAGTDLDGDGSHELLDLDVLSAVSVWHATSPPTRLLGPLRTAESLQPLARFGDLNGDGHADAVLASSAALYILLSEAKAR